MTHRYQNLDKLHLPPRPENASLELQKILDALVDEVGVRKIVAFGSCVRGNISEHSDIDLCVVSDPAKQTSHPRWEARQAIARHHPRLGFDLLVLPPAQWEEQCHAPFGIFQEIMQEGLPIYER